MATAATTATNNWREKRRRKQSACGGASGFVDERFEPVAQVVILFEQAVERHDEWNLQSRRVVGAAFQLGGFRRVGSDRIELLHDLVDVLAARVVVIAVAD